jgi:hypothetical protein
MTQLLAQAATGANPGDDVATVFSRAEALCRAVAGPDLADVPLYIVSQSRLPAHLGGQSTCGGFTMLDLDLYVRDYIECNCGRGACMVVNDASLRECWGNAYEHALVGVVLHELAHMLVRPRLFFDRTGEDPARIEFEANMMNEIVLMDDPPDMAPYEGHGDRFIRAVLHLQHRAEAAGVPIGAGAIFNGSWYGLSHASRYQEALGDEPCRMADRLFKDILAAKPPAAFDSLWRDDILAWLRHQQNQGGTKMSVMKLLDKIAGRQSARTNRRLADFKELVRAVADGQDPDADLVDGVLNDCGKTVDDLREAVELLVRRRALRASFDALPKIAKEREAVVRQIAAADRALQEAEDRHDEVTAPLYARVQELKQATSDGEQARHDLVQTCSDEALLSQSRDLADRLDVLRDRLGRCRNDAGVCQARATAAREECERVRREAMANVRTDDAERLKAHIADLRQAANANEARARALETESASMTREMADLERQQEDVRVKMLEP